MQDDDTMNDTDERRNPSDSPEAETTAPGTGAREGTAQAEQDRRRRRMKSRRKWLMGGLAAVFVVIAVLYGAYWLLVLRYEASTDDAYVHGNKIMLTPQIDGTAVSIGADDTDLVRAGQPVVKLDKSNTRVSLARAKANLAQTVRHVRQLYAQQAEQKAAIKTNEAQLAQARRDFHRNRQLLKVNGVSREKYQHSSTALKGARSKLAASKEKLKALQAITADTTLPNNPQVKLAEAQLRKAYLNFQRTTIPAPVTGHVAQRQVQVGQKVSPSEPMMAIVPQNQIWVQANFKETDVEKMRIGQPVKLHADFYGGDVTYHGRVAGISAGTGSAFELLPPQNATGNWIKVVQRVPVRITLKPKEVRQHPLRLGLSMSVEVDLHDTSGQVLARTPPPKPVYTTDVYERRKVGAKALIQGIVAANAGKNVAKASASHDNGG